MYLNMWVKTGMLGLPFFPARCLSGSRTAHKLQRLVDSTFCRRSARSPGGVGSGAASLRRETARASAMTPIAAGTDRERPVRSSQAGFVAVLRKSALALPAALLHCSLVTASVWAAAPVSITVSPSNVILYAGETQQFSATCHYSDNSEDDCTQAGGVIWKRTEIRLGTISPGGLYTAQPYSSYNRLGYIEAAVGSVHGFAYLAQTPDPGVTVKSINAMSPATNSIVVAGATLWASARVAFSDGTQIPGSRVVTWTSSNPAVATVDWEGHIATLAAGSTSLTATARGQSASAVTSSTTLKVVAAPAGLFKTWYVRPGGGTRYSYDNPTGQCDGQHDADYPGSGVNKPCAFSSWKWLWNTGRAMSWAISGGDTVILRQNPSGTGDNQSWLQVHNGVYDAGYDSGYDDFGLTKASYATCGGSGSSGCTNPPIPGGSASNPTRLYGENWAACEAPAAKTQIYGTGNTGAVLNLANTSNVELRCLGISDRSACITGGPKGAHTCVAGTDSFAKNGISVSSTTTNVKLIDVDIHGMAGNGWVGMPGDGIEMTRVRAAGNHTAGLNFDPGGSYVQGGGVVARQLLVEWNGCSEEYPVLDLQPYFDCADQSNAGYGDGVGTADTGGRWEIYDSRFRYNTQDGLDLLHVSLPGATFVVERSQSYGNMGQQFKLGMADRTSFLNNSVGGYCMRLSGPFAGTPDGYNKYLSDFCRANGTAVVITQSSHTRYFIDGNDWVGNSNISLETECADAWGGQSSGDCSSTDGGGIYFRNNIMRGYIKGYGQNVRTSAFYLGNGAQLGVVFLNRQNNLFYGVRSDSGGACPTGYGGEICADPLFADAPTDAEWEASHDQALWDRVDFHLKPASPAIGAGVALDDLTLDGDGVSRSNSAPTIGCFVAGSPGMGQPDPGSPTKRLRRPPVPQQSSGASAAHTEDQ